MLIKYHRFPEGLELPYSVTIEKPIGNIGVFGDSFAQLAEFMSSGNNNHESSWIYFLSNILQYNCDTYGISRAGMGDIFHTLLNCEIEYDYYIIFHTRPTRENLFSKIKFKYKTCLRIKEFLKDKKCLIIYWDKNHKIFDFDKPTHICTHHLTNQNPGEVDTAFVRDVNPLDQLGGFHHMSARGNLLFALELSKMLHLK